MDAAVFELQRFLRQMRVATLATVDDAGAPYAVSLFMVADEQARLYFTSDPATAHARHVCDRPQVHVAAHAPNVAWTQARGVQVHGVCHQVHSEEHDTVGALYRQRFPFAAEVLEEASAARFYRIMPSCLRWIDNRVHFGFKVDYAWPVFSAPVDGQKVKEIAR